MALKLLKAAFEQLFWVFFLSSSPQQLQNFLGGSRPPDPPLLGGTFGSILELLASLQRAWYHTLGGLFRALLLCLRARSASASLQKIVCCSPHCRASSQSDHTTTKKSSEIRTCIAAWPATPASTSAPAICAAKLAKTQQMPLLNKQEYTAGPRLPPDASETEDFFVVRCTGEALRNYEEYLAKTTLYRARNWQCKFSKKGGLTYDEALASEERHLQQLATVSVVVVRRRWLAVARSLCTSVWRARRDMPHFLRAHPSTTQPNTELPRRPQGGRRSRRAPQHAQGRRPDRQRL